jgi:hypothetical protein
MTNKMTYVDALNIAIETLTDADVIEKLTALRDQTAKRNSTENRKPTKTQQENAELQKVVLAALTREPCTISELMTRDARLSALSNQKVAALTNALVKSGDALKIPDGRKMTFALA